MCKTSADTEGTALIRRLATALLTLHAAHQRQAARVEALETQLYKLEEYAGHLTEVVNSLTADADKAERIPVIDWQRGSRLEQ